MAIQSAFSSDLEYGHAFRQVVLTLGYRCNMFCKHCFIGEKLSDGETKLAFDDCVRIVDSAARLETIQAVAFVGGEPFAFYPLMLQVATYIYSYYRCPLNVTTNASWARSPEMTQRLLDPLYERGLRMLMVSLDQYHLEFGNLEQIINCLRRAHELGIETSAQIIHRIGAPGEKEFREALAPHVDVESIHWYENPCSPIGNAKTMIPVSDLVWYDEIPEGGCNAGEILNIQPDGEIKPCCGAGLMAERLSLGNAKYEAVHEAVHRSEADALLNSLIAEQGPRGLARLLQGAGREDLVLRHAPFTDACHACFSFLTDAEVLTVLEECLQERQIEMLANRILATHTIEIMQHLNVVASS